MKTLLFTLGLIASSFNFLHAQNDSLQTSGLKKFEFKKNSFSLDVVGGYSFLANAARKTYRLVDGEFKEAMNIYSLGLRINYLRQLKTRIQVGIEYQYIQTNNIETGIGFVRRATGARIVDNTVMPVLQIFTSKDQSRFSVYHQFGLGLTVTTISLPKDFTYSSNYKGDLIESHNYLGKLIFPENLKPFYGISTMYGLGLKHRLTENVQLNYGFRYQFSYLFGAFMDRDHIESEHEFSNICSNEALGLASNLKPFHIYKLNLGLTYSF